MDVDKIIDSMLDGTSDGASETPTTRDTPATTAPPSDGGAAVLGLGIECKCFGVHSIDVPSSMSYTF